MTITAIYDGKVLWPETTVNLKPDTRYRLKVEEEIPSTQKPDAWDAIEAMIGSVPGPEDWAQNHDHYLYGTPRQVEKL